MADILVVDDWPINREFLVTLLRYAGHEVREAADGAEALAEMQRVRPDLVITDVLMPVMDGAELVRRIAANQNLANVPIVFYTATYRLSEAQVTAAACGVTTVLAKPSEPQEVLDAVHGELGLPLMALASVDRSSQVVSVPGKLSIQGLQRAYLQEIGGLRAELQTSVGELGSPDGEAHRLRRLATRVDDSFLLAQGLSMRLATLIELGIELSRREAPTEMLTVFCRAAHDVLNAKFAVACLFDESGNLLELASSGFTTAQQSALRRTVVPTDGLFGDLLRDGQTQLRTAIVDHAEIGLPLNHPRITNLLAARVASRSRTFGWFYVAERLGTGGFSSGDVQLMEILAAQLSTQYENRVLLDRSTRHAGLLEVEIRERRQALDQLRESELRFRQLAENIRDVFFLIEAGSGVMLYMSPAYTEVWQRSVESLLAAPMSWFDAVHPDDREYAAAEMARMQGTGRFNIEHRIVRPDKTVRWIKARGFPIRDESGLLYRIAGIAEDITEAKLNELRIARLSRILRVLSSINSTIVRTHERGALLDEACRIAFDEGGFPVVWVGLIAGDALTVAASRGLDSEAISEVEAELGSQNAEQWKRTRNGLSSKQVVVHRDLESATDGEMESVARRALAEGCRSMATLPLLLDDEPVGFIVLYSKDIDLFDKEELALLNELAGDVSFALKYLAKEDQINYLAYYDSLTSLPNGTLFHERLSQMLDRKPPKAALYLVDLDRFTHLNDSLGRHIGDRLLVSVAERLAALAPEANLLGRVGADTFAIAVSSLRSDSEAGSILQERIFSAMNRPFEIGNTALRVSARAGIAMYPADGTDAEMIFKNAEAALKGAKASNARFMFYSPQLNSSVAEDLELEQELRGAVERQEFVIYYQPKVTANSGELVGLEALLRWRRKDGTIIGPERFVRALEDSELIIDVGRWVIEQVLADHRDWAARGFRVPRIAVNVSPIQLRYGDFPEMVLETLANSGVEGSPLELEITESVIMADIDASTQRLQRLNDVGVSIAIDDFGTGYSSLRYLATLPVDTLKIDRSFIVRMALEPDSMTLVSTMINLAHAFELTVVAEGVDSEEQAHLLRLMKCDMLQGYLFGKPVPAEQIEALLPQ